MGSEKLQMRMREGERRRRVERSILSSQEYASPQDTATTPWEADGGRERGRGERNTVVDTNGQNGKKDTDYRGCQTFSTHPLCYFIEPVLLP